MKRYISVLALVMIISGILAACGGGDGSTSKEPVGTATPTGNTVDLTIAATNFKFNEAEYRVKAGDTVNVTFVNEQGMHGIDIRGLNIKMKDGNKATFVAQKGEYDIVCNIMCGSGHAKMVSKLIVE